jgi:hypothetical protein
MTTDFDAGAIHYQGDRPVAVGDLRLATPTRMASTPAGFWGLYDAGGEVLLVHPGGAVRGPADEVRARLQAMIDDQGRDDVDRDAARSFLPFLGGDDPGAAAEAPRTRVEAGPPPTYSLSDERNAPPAAEPPDRPGASQGPRR